METEQRITAPDSLPGDRDLDRSLRPLTFEDYIGQDRLKSNLEVFVAAARQRGEALDHSLFYGPPGLGKTTIAGIIAAEMDAHLHSTSGPVLEKAADLAGLLTNLEEGDVLFIDEIHRLNKVVEEYLYSAMEDFRLDILIDRGPAARSIQLNLPPFTLVAATTRAGLLSAPLRDRFGITGRLNYYTKDNLQTIVERNAKKLEINMDDDAATQIALRSRGTPRVANRLLRRLRDFAEVEGGGILTASIAADAMTRLEIDKHGLDEMDKRILTAIIQKYRGGPVGLGTLAVTVGEDAGTIEELYEPYLIQQGLIERTPRGRVATANAYSWLKINLDNNDNPATQATLF